MWAHVKTLQHQLNTARKLYPDTEQANYTRGDQTIQEYYNGFLTLWIERDSIIINSFPQQQHPDVLKIQAEPHTSQFLMNRHPEFKVVHAAPHPMIPFLAITPRGRNYKSFNVQNPKELSTLLEIAKRNVLVVHGTDKIKDSIKKLPPSSSSARETSVRWTCILSYDTSSN